MSAHIASSESMNASTHLTGQSRDRRGARTGQVRYHPSKTTMDSQKHPTQVAHHRDRESTMIPEEGMLPYVSRFAYRGQSGSFKTFSFSVGDPLSAN